MTKVATRTSAGVLLVTNAQDAPCRDRAAGRSRSHRGVRRSIATALKRAGMGAVGALWFAPAPALAYHGTTGNGVGIPLDIVLPIAGAVALGAIALAVWGRKRRKTKFKGGKPKRRAKPLDRKHQ